MNTYNYFDSLNATQAATDFTVVIKKKKSKHILEQTHTREGVFDWAGVSWVPLLAVPGNVHCSETRGTGGREGGRGGGRHVARSLRLHPLSLFLFLSRLISLLLDSTQFKGTLLAWLTKINNIARGVYITISPVLRLFMSLSLWNISSAPLPSPLSSSYIPLSLSPSLSHPFTVSILLSSPLSISHLRSLFYSLVDRGRSSLLCLQARVFILEEKAAQARKQCTATPSWWAHSQESQSSNTSHSNNTAKRYMHT